MKKPYLSFIALISFMYLPLLAQTGLDSAQKALKNKNWQEAKTLLEQAIEQNEKNARAHYLLGQCLIALKEYDEAADAFEEAAELEPDSALYYYRYGQALGMEAQNSGVLTQAWLAPKIKSAFERAVELDPTLMGARIALANFYVMAPGFMGGDMDKARQQAKALIRMGNFNGKIILARIYLKEEKNDSALVLYNQMEKEINDDPKYYNFYNTYGYLLLGQKQYDKAIEKFKKQVELAPDKANPYDSLGDAYRAAGRIEEAKAQYRKALQIDPQFESSRKKLEELQN